MKNLSTYTKSEYHSLETSPEILAAIEEFSNDDILIERSLAWSIWAGTCDHVDGIELIIIGRAWEIANNQSKHDENYEIPETLNWGTKTDIGKGF